MAIVFDIETIPKQTPLTSYQKEYYDKKYRNALSYGGVTQEEDQDNNNKLSKKTMALSPHLGKIVCIGLLDTATDETHSLHGDELEMLSNFWKIIEKEEQFVSFNGIDFDVPYIVFRSAYYRITIPRPHNVPHKFLTRTRFTQKPHFDLMKWTSDWDKYSSLTLSMVCGMLGIESPKEGEIKAENVADAFAQGKIQQIMEYCIRDVRATWKAARIWSGYMPNQKRY